MIDLHAHLLPGLDDGPSSVEEALAIARRAVSDGTSTAVATPHIDHLHDLSPRAVLDAGVAFRRALRAAGVPLQLRTGGEVTVVRAGELSQDELGALALGSSSWVLLECPLRSGEVPSLEEGVFALALRGFKPLLAHPERSPQLLGDVERVRELVARGALCSVTAGALVGRFGPSPRRFAHRLLAEGLVHNVASDAHDLARRPPELASALDVAGIGRDRARWLAQDVPRALLADAPVPDAPEDPRVRRRTRRRARERRPLLPRA